MRVYLSGEIHTDWRDEIIASSKDLDITFEDKDILVLNKQSGISIHPGAGNYDKTVVNALIKYCNKNLSDVGETLDNF